MRPLRLADSRLEDARATARRRRNLRSAHRPAAPRVGVGAAPQAARTSPGRAGAWARTAPAYRRTTICASPSTTTPRTGPRVVCALRDTIDTLAPTSALISVDLPHWARRSARQSRKRSSVMRRPAIEKSLRRGLFGGALGARLAALGLEAVELDLHDEARHDARGRSAATSTVARRRQSRAPAPIPAPRSWRPALGRASARMRASQVRAHQRPRRLESASRNTAPISDSQMSRRIAAFLRPPAARFALAQHDMRPDVPFLARPPRRSRAAPAREPHRQIAFAALADRRGRASPRPPAQHAVAQELEALIGGPPRRPPCGAETWVKARASSSASAKTWPSRASSAEISGLARFGRRVQWTRMKQRLQRTDVGQRQNCQAAAPSSTEKKMISARPTRFSSGT